MTAPEAKKDEYWWAPWAVLVAIVIVGVLGFFGVLSPKRGGATAADVPVIAPSAAPKAAPRAPTPE